MKTKIIKSKFFILGLIVGISLIGTGVYASVTGGGTIGALFERLGSSGAYYYRLNGDNIKDDTVDSSEIENGTIAKIDLNVNLQNSIEQIEINKTDIATNTTNIATNTTNIATNTTNIATNTTDIATITTNNNKVNLGSNWTIIVNGDDLEFRYNNVKKITFTKDGDIIANQYTY